MVGLYNKQEKGKKMKECPECFYYGRCATWCRKYDFLSRWF